MALRLVILLACTLFAAFGQAPKAWPIGKLAVEGNKFYADELILEVAGMKIGQMAGKAEFDAARDRLLATGAFESIGYKFEPIPGTQTNFRRLPDTRSRAAFPVSLRGASDRRESVP